MPARKKAAGPAQDGISLGRIAYEAYVAAGEEDAGFSSVTGVRLPSWPEQEGRIQARWEKAAAAVSAHVRASLPEASGSP
jgi:hypothetical protein